MVAQTGFTNRHALTSYEVRSLPFRTTHRLIEKQLEEAEEVHIKIGEPVHHIDCAKIPYLRSFVHFNRVRGTLNHAESSAIAQFGAVIIGMERGWRYCFKQLGYKLKAYYQFFETLRFLGLKTSRHSFAAVARVFLGYMPHRARNGIHSDALPSRNWALILLGHILTDDFESQPRASEVITDVILFVTGRPDPFKTIDCWAFRAAWIDRFQPAAEQVEKLDKRLRRHYRRAGVSVTGKVGCSSPFGRLPGDFPRIDWGWLCGEEHGAADIGVGNAE